MVRTVLITGSNRGIGLALARRCLVRGDAVLAACRDPASAEELRELAGRSDQRATVLPMDVDDDASVAAAADQAARRVERLDVLVNNAARGPMDGEGELASLDLAGALDTFRTNSLSPLRVARAFLPLLKAGQAPRVVNITSGAGNITAKDDHAMYAYGASKAALNFLTRALSAELKSAGILVAAVGPGWVRTRMGGDEADLSPEESARGLLSVIDGLSMDDTGQWFTVEGRRRDTW